MPLPGAYQLTVPKFRPRDTLDHDANIRAVERAINRVPIFDIQILKADLGTANTTSASLVDMALNAGGAPVVTFTVYDNKSRVVMGVLLSSYCSVGPGVQYVGFRFQKTGVDISFDMTKYFHNFSGANARHDSMGGWNISTPGQLPPGTYTVTARWACTGGTTINTDNNDAIHMLVEERPTFP